MNNYLNFLKTLKLPIELSSFLAENQHSDLHLAGWQGITNLICLDNNNETYDLDIRYAWGQEIFKQHLFDHGWNHKNLTNSSIENQINRHKIIIYLCNFSLKLEQAKIITQVPDKFLIGNYWQTIYHCYLQLPLEHPFDLIFLDKNNSHFRFATTRNITQQKPNIKQLGKLISHPQQKGKGGLRTKGLFKQSLPNLPLISVITVVFNGEKYLEQTIQSIINSTYPNLEYIVIDGASQDNSIGIIKQYEDYIDYWVSEPDDGIYDAMNKGTVAASGDYTLHINADDLLFNAQCLEIVIEEIQTEYSQQLANVFSTILFYRLDKGRLSPKTPRIPDSDPLLNIVKIPGGHQGFLGIRNNSSLFNSQQYQIVAERVMMSEKIKCEPVTTTQTITAICRSGGVSYGVNFAMLNEMTRATVKSRNPQIFMTLLIEYLRLSLLWFVKITKLIKLKPKI